MPEKLPEGSGEPLKGLSTKWPLRLIAISACAILLGFGLCAVDAKYFPAQAAQEFGPNSFVGGIGAWVIVLSALGLLLSTLALVTCWIANAMQKD